MVKCPECHKSFVTQQLLQNHVLRYHKRKPSSNISFACSLCKQTFTNHATAKSHLRTCKGKGQTGSDQQRSFDLAGTSHEEDTAESDIFHDPDDDANPVDLSTDLECSGETDLELELQEEIANFLTRLKEKFNATQTVVNEVVSGVNKIQERFLEIIKKNLQLKGGQVGVLSTSDAIEVVEELKGLSLFEGVETKDEVLKYLIENHGLVMPQKVGLRKEGRVRNEEFHEIDADFFYRVPFLDQLRKLLSCPDVLDCVKNPRKSDPSFFRTLTDGLIYKNHPVTKAFGDNPLGILLYHDGIEVTDVASSRSGKNHLTNFYWTLGNIYPELRSTDQGIQLLAAVKTNCLKTYGYEPILEDFVHGVNQLSSPDGVTVTLNGRDEVFHGFVLCVCGDYPASGALGKFKESVTAEKPCRNCLASKSGNYLQITDLLEFQMRSKELHEKHVAEVLAYQTLRPKERANLPDPSVAYGVNGRSVLMDIKYCDITQILVQDVMHAAHEGCLELMCRLIICHVVLEKKKLSLQTVNERITSLSRFFKSDKPSSISSEHLQKTLRQSAAQMRSLSLILPFVLRVKTEDDQWIFGGDPQYLDCFLSFSKWLHLAMAYEFKEEDVNRLNNLTQIFHKQLLELVENLSMAKVHFLHHVAQLIHQYGSIRQVACFRFEAHHAYFKRLVRILHNSVNLLQSLSVRHQTKQCYSMMSPNYLYGGHQQSVKRDVSTAKDSTITQVRKIFPNAQQIKELSRLQVYGTVYSQDRVILLNAGPGLPEFGVIQKIFSVDENSFVLHCQRVHTKIFDQNVNAFEVMPGNSKTMVALKDLEFPHEILSLHFENKWYLIPLGHRALLS